MACEEVKNGMIGSSVPVRDAALKVTGQMRYVADMKLPGMLYAKILYSPVPHARIKSIDTSAAEALEGVEAVVMLQGFSQEPLQRKRGGQGHKALGAGV